MGIVFRRCRKFDEKGLSNYKKQYLNLQNDFDTSFNSLIVELRIRLEGFEGVIAMTEYHFSIVLLLQSLDPVVRPEPGI